MSKFKIRLTDCRFQGKIGVLDQERKVGNEFRIDITVTMDADSFEMENLETSISYVDIYAIAEKVMSKQWLLLESVSKAIAEEIRQLSDKISETTVKITKTSVPITGMQGESSVEYII